MADSESSFAERVDVYTSITARIIQAIEAGAGEFVMPWHRSGPALSRPANAATGAKYRGVNVVALWAEATLASYSSGHWATYRQWQQLGAQVRRGERGATTVFYKQLTDEREGAEGEDERSSRRMFARASHVFNADQVDGWSKPEELPRDLVSTLPRVEGFVGSTGAAIRHGGSTACYRRAEDLVEMPERRRFIGTLTSTPTESYYAVLLHELVHWTGAAHRLNRACGWRMADDAYAREELIAELGAAFLCADLGIANDPRPDHAAYLASWLAVLKADPRALFGAARMAMEAVSHLDAQQDQTVMGN